MKYIILFLSAVFLLSNTPVMAQKRQAVQALKYFPATKLTVEPAIGINPAPMADISITNLIQWNILRQLNLTSHTSLNFNGPFKRNFNYITTNYNLSVIQKVGVGASFYTRKTSHTLSLMAGIKYDAYKETMNNPEFEKVSVTTNTINPDFGIMYNGKVGQKKFFFSYRAYIPLYPYPVRGLDFNAIESNVANISLELGFGIRLK